MHAPVKGENLELPYSICGNPQPSPHDSLLLGHFFNIGNVGVLDIILQVSAKNRYYQLPIDNYVFS